MDHHRESIEFETVLDGRGAITVPPGILKHFLKTTGQKLHVRLTTARLSSAMKRIGVTEEEIDRISTLQMESRDQVVSFLLSEGALRNNKALLRRAAKLTGGTS